MKNSTHRLNHLLLAAAVALPLLSVTSAVRSADMNADHRPTMEEGRGGGHGGGPDGPDGGPGGRGPMGPPPGAGFSFGPGFAPQAPLFRGVELTEAQEDNIFAILHAEKPYLREQAKAAGKAQEALRALVDGDKMPFKEWEKDTPYFEGCMPIEVMAERGLDTLRYGPMKPVGLDNPKTGRWPHAVVQLRQDNAQGTLWNIVGFQTKLKHAEQVRLFRTIPGLQNAEFARLGGLHRNTFIRSPELLDETLRLKSRPNIRFAGQITGCEGYIESASIGLLAGRFAAAELNGTAMSPPPVATALGALLGHITGLAEVETYQPMNVNFGLFPPIPGRTKKADRKRMYTDRARTALAEWMAA